jgi:hypothetical protein
VIPLFLLVNALLGFTHSIEKRLEGTCLFKKMFCKNFENVPVSPAVVLAIFVFPSHKNNVYMLSKVYCYFVYERKFLAVRRVGLMTHREYRVDRPFPVT